MAKEQCNELLELWYTTDDDGIWAECSNCKMRIKLGWQPTITDVAAAQLKHDEHSDAEIENST